MKFRTLRCDLGASLLTLVIAFAGCATSLTDEGTNNDVSADVGDADGSVLSDADPDAATDGGDTGNADQGAGLQLGFGESCQANDDCESRFCVAGPNGFVCTQQCSGDCPDLDGESMVCRLVTNLGADELRVCVPIDDAICTPCLDDRNCFEGFCVGLDDQTQVCGLDCEQNEDCPSGTLCFDTLPSVGPLDHGQCLPENLTCDCSADNDGDFRSCARSNIEGTRTCTGSETCQPALGWVGCDAPTPAPEICDGVDNDCNGAVDDGIPGLGDACEVTTAGIESTCDGILFCDSELGRLSCVGQVPEAESCDLFDNNCDGEIDEDFKSEDSLYVTDEHCGVCGNDCASRFPEGYESACQLVDDEPQCVITQCPEGTAPAGLTACVPLESALCLPCNIDTDCNELVGDRCISDDDGNGFCGRDCGAESPFGTICPDGYSCDGELSQCLLDEGGCNCNSGDNFFLACEILAPDEFTVCLGRQHCDDGDLGDCVAPLEVCDGFDNNCDGRVDEGALNQGTDVYDTDENCDRCFNDCTVLFTEDEFNASGGVCEANETAAACVPECEGQFLDADGLSFNGCECEFLGDDPGFDPLTHIDPPDVNGLDEDCDGIDGDLERGVFVSTTGSGGATGTIDDPFPTISEGLAAATVDDLDHVYVEAGVYDETFALRSEISLFGGYSPNFRSRDISGNETVIIGDGSRLGTVEASNITTTTVFDGFTVVGFSRDGTAETSYAVRLIDSNDQLELVNNDIRAGDGGNGLSGGAGGDGIDAAVGAEFFSASEPGVQPSALDAFCGSEVSDGGDGARFSCVTDGDDEDSDGGNGGTSNCPQGAGPESTGIPGSDVLGVSGGDGGVGGFSTVWGYFNANDTLWTFNLTGNCVTDAVCSTVTTDNTFCVANRCQVVGVTFDPDTSCSNNAQCRTRYANISFCLGGTTCGLLDCCAVNPTACNTGAGTRFVPDPTTDCDCNVCTVPDGETETIEGLDGVNGLRGRDGDAGASCAANLGTVSGNEWQASLAGGGGGIGGPGSGGGGGGAGGGAADENVCIETVEFSAAAAAAAAPVVAEERAVPAADTAAAHLASWSSSTAPLIRCL